VLGEELVTRGEVEQEEESYAKTPSIDSYNEPAVTTTDQAPATTAAAPVDDTMSYFARLAAEA
jgi:hypothetical protein